MNRYFFHLRDGTDEVLDSEGVVLPAEAIAGAALIAARDCMSGDVKNGRLELHFRIDVHREDGALAHTQSFADALEIVPPR